MLGYCTSGRCYYQSENYDLNNIIFSNYKNHTTGKICVWTAPSGFLLHYIEAYPGSISDSAITKQSQVLDSVPRGKTTMTDKGFNNNRFMSSKGSLAQQTPHETESVNNFKIEFILKITLAGLETGKY